MVVEWRSEECYNKEEGSIQNVLQNWAGRTQNILQGNEKLNQESDC